MGQSIWGTGFGYVFLIVFLVGALAIYFIPTIIARRRKHPSRNSILIVNIFLGWTFLGWVGALAWSFSGAKPNET